MAIIWVACCLVWISCSRTGQYQGSFLWWPGWVDRFYLASRAWLDVNWVYRQELDAMASFWEYSKQLDISCIYSLANMVYGSMDSLRPLAG